MLISLFFKQKLIRKPSVVFYADLRQVITNPRRTFLINTADRHENEMAQLLDKAKNHMISKQYSEAIRVYQDCTKIIETKSNKKDSAILYINYLMSKAYYQNKEYAKAISAAELIINENVKEVGPTNLQYISESYSIIANSYFEQNDLKKAEDYMKVCIKFKRENSDHVISLISYEKFLSSLYMRQKKYQEAITLLEEYLSQTTLKDSPFGSSLADLNYILAEAYEKSGKYEKAISNYEIALKNGIFKDKLEDQVLVESKIGLLYLNQKNHQKAKELATQVIERLSKVANAEISKISLANCVEIFKEVKDESLLLNILKAWVQNAKEDSLISHEIVRSIIRLTDEKFDASQAKENISNLLEIIKKRESQGYLEKAEAMSFLAKIEKSLNNHEPALKLYTEAIELIKQSKKIPNIVPTILIQLADIYFLTKKYDLALDSMYESLGVISKFFNKSHPDAITIYSQAGNILRSLGGHKEAREYFEKALLLAIDTLGQEHKITAFSYINLGDSLIRTGMNKDGEEFIQNGLANLQKRVDKESREYLDALEIIFNCYLKTSKMKEASKIGKERLKIMKTLYGPENLDYLESLINTGSALVDNAAADDALSLFQEALSLTKVIKDSDKFVKILNIEIERALRVKRASI